MLIAKNDEEKRSKVWRYVTWSTTLLIILIAAYFIYDGFAGNPLEGSWVQDESNMVLEIRKNNVAVLTWENLTEGGPLEVNLEYKLEKKKKEITFKVNQEEVEQAAEKVGDDITAAEVQSVLSSILTSFHYNEERNELTLTEWDYGDQMFFTKQQ